MEHTVIHTITVGSKVLTATDEELGVVTHVFKLPHKQEGYAGTTFYYVKLNNSAAGWFTTREVTCVQENDWDIL